MLAELSLQLKELHNFADVDSMLSTSQHHVCGIWKFFLEELRSTDVDSMVSTRQHHVCGVSKLFQKKNHAAKDMLRLLLVLLAAGLVLFVAAVIAVGLVLLAAVIAVGLVL